MPLGVSVLVSAVFFTSICGTGGKVTVDEHGGGVLLGEHTPPGGSIVAVLATDAGGLAAIVAVTVYVATLPAGNGMTVSLIAPLPPTPQFAPPEPVHVQVALAMPSGTVSVTSAPLASTAPVFVAVIV